MNDQDANRGGSLAGLPAAAPGHPPIIPPLPARADHEPLGSQPGERVPVGGVVAAVEALLRQPRRVLFQLKQPNPGALIASLLLIAALCAIVYGLVVGSFSGGTQIWAAPAKIAAGLLVSALICLPSLYIFACLSGSEVRLAEAFGLITGLLALLTVLLVGFAPVAWVFSQSTKSVAAMGALHLGFWLVATVFGLRFLHAGMVHTRAQTMGGFGVWVVIFLAVALQMTTALRPLVGTSATLLPDAKDKKFFVSHWLECVDQESNPVKADQPKPN